MPLLPQIVDAQRHKLSKYSRKSNFVFGQDPRSFKSSYKDEYSSRKVLKSAPRVPPIPLESSEAVTAALKETTTSTERRSVTTSDYSRLPKLSATKWAHEEYKRIMNKQMDDNVKRNFASYMYNGYPRRPKRVSSQVENKDDKLEQLRRNYYQNEEPSLENVKKDSLPPIQPAFKSYADRGVYNFNQFIVSSNFPQLK